jgi:hypothetical protein
MGTSAAQASRNATVPTPGSRPTASNRAGMLSKKLIFVPTPRATPTVPRASLQKINAKNATKKKKWNE